MKLYPVIDEVNKRHTVIIFNLFCNVGRFQMWLGDGEPVRRHVMFDVVLWVLVTFKGKTGSGYKVY